MKKSCILLFVFFFSLVCAHAETPWSKVEKVFGRKGMMLPGGVFKVPFPRTDLSVKIGGIRLEPAFGTSSWAGFKATGHGAMMMGDLCLLENEIEPVMKKLTLNGIGVTALHNHLLWESPIVMFIHFKGTGDPVKMAVAFKEALSLTATPLKPVASPPAAEGTQKSPDWSTVERILGRKGTVKKNLLLISIPKTGVTEDGMEVPPSLIGDVINFQRVGSRVATTGDFPLLSHQVNPVMQALLAHGITVTAIHNHMLFENPRLFYMHWWGLGSPAEIAEGIKEALEKAGVKP